MMQHKSEKQDVISVYPSCLSGSVRVPMSKSLLHRALICAALSGDLSLCVLDAHLPSQDILATQTCIKILMRSAPSQTVDLDCVESGSTLRFLLPLAAALGVRARFLGKGRLPYRPLAEYQAILSQHGVELTFENAPASYLPAQVSGQLQPGVFHVPGHISSQYITGLLLALPLLAGDSAIELTSKLESAPYVDMSLSVMAAFGVNVSRTANGFQVVGKKRYNRTTPFVCEPDFSQAAFWLVAEYLGHKVQVMDLPQTSCQGDQLMIDLLRQLQAIKEGRHKLPKKEWRVDAAQIPDLIPVLSIAAAATSCVTRIQNAGRLRLKESDRLEATRAMLDRLGVRVDCTDDELCIEGQDKPTFKAAVIDAFSDHRMVMAAAIAASCASGPVDIIGYRAIDKSYPTFFSDYTQLGGKIDGFDVGT